MESYEHRSHATLGLPVIVETKSHFIIGAEALYIKSRSHYPPLQDKNNLAYNTQILNKRNLITSLLKQCRFMKPLGRIIIDTDKHKSYPKYMEDAFGKEGVHVPFKSDAETEKQRLFPVNNMRGCLRADVAMLGRDTRHVCNDKEMTANRLKIYTLASVYSRYLINIDPRCSYA